MVFKPGNCANPKGRKPGSSRKDELQRDLMFPHVIDAVETIVKNLNNKNRAVAQRAAEDILNRVYGAPGKSIELTGKDGGPMQSLTEIIVNVSRKHDATGKSGKD